MTATTKDRTDLYQKVTDKLIELLEAGSTICDRLWVSGGAQIPLRVTNEPYRGVNCLILWMTAIERGYEHRHWLTYRMAHGMGAQVRRGEKAEMVVYADHFTKPIENRETGETQDTDIWFLKPFWVFNASQIDGLPAAFYEKPTTKLMDKPEKIDSARRFVAHTGAKIIEDGNRAFYRPADDTIRMPEIEKFNSVESYHAVELHELVHWSGAKERLDREIGRDFRSPDYAREELVAEIGSAFLCASLEITPEVRPDHAGYLESWLKVLKADKRAIFAAAAQAQKAADFLHGLQSTP